MSNITSCNVDEKGYLKKIPKMDSFVAVRCGFLSSRPPTGDGYR